MLLGTMFTSKDVAEYYNTTLNHYEQWWKLRKHLSLHYGVWEKGTKSFAESLVNTNRVLAELSAIKESDHVLDAGCGVGGAAMYLAQSRNTQAVGISVSEKQVEYANSIAQRSGLHNKVSFQVMDYANTSFEDESFDVIWACESVSSAQNKPAFIQEAYRLLKKGGRLIMSDFFLTVEDQQDKHNWILKWIDTWGISNLVSSKRFVRELETAGFCIKESLDYTDKIRKSAKRLYRSALLGAVPSELYNLTHPKVSRFAKTHYRSGYYQWRALQVGLWKYGIIFAIKV